MPIPLNIKEQIVDLYNQNNSIRAIKDFVGVSEPTISKILKSYGIEIRKINYQKLNIDQKVVERMYYEEKKTTYEIAKFFGCSDEPIRKMLIVRPISERNMHTDEYKEQSRMRSKKLWNDPEYVSKVMDGLNTPDAKKALRDASIRNYPLTLGKWIKEDSSKMIISDKAKALWNDPEYRRKQTAWFGVRGKMLTDAMREFLSDPVKKAKWLDSLRMISANKQCNTGWVSTQQKQLYYILQSSNISFHEEGQDTKIGPFYVVDCVIPVQQRMAKPLIVEVQGEYWHGLRHVVAKDKQKETYIRKHTNYDLLKIDELEFSSFNSIASKLSEYGIDIPSEKFSVRELELKQITESDARLFYSTFHYSSTIRKGATTFGAFINGGLVACISYTHPLRIESANRLGYALGEVLEISRM